MPTKKKKKYLSDINATKIINLKNPCEAACVCAYFKIQSINPGKG